MWAAMHRPEMRDPRGYIIPSTQPDFGTATKFINALLEVGIIELRELVADAMDDDDLDAEAARIAAAIKAGKALTWLDAAWMTATRCLMASWTMEAAASMANCMTGRLLAGRCT